MSNASIVCSAMWSQIFNMYRKFSWILTVKTMLATCSSAEVGQDLGKNTRLNSFTHMQSLVICKGTEGSEVTAQLGTFLKAELRRKLGLL